MAGFRAPKPFFEKRGTRGVLLLHAYSGSSNDVRMLSRYLEKFDYTVYAPIFSGHGTAEPKDILAEDLSTWQQEVIDALAFLKKEGLTQVAVFGLSMGGIFAMDRLTSGDPMIIGGGSFCSPLFKTANQVPQNFLLYAEALYQRVGLTKDVIQGKLAELQQLIPSQLQAIEDFGEKVASRLAQVAVPVFLAQGGADEMIDPGTVFKIAEALQQTDVLLRWYPTSGHVITVDPVHQQFEREVLAFLGGLPWNEENK